MIILEKIALFFFDLIDKYYHQKRIINFLIKNKIKINFFIVDHKLRKESSSEAKDVRNVLKMIDIECKILTWNGKKPSKNIQATARNKRYSLLVNECKKNDIKYLLLGHHLNDLFENF